MSSTPPSPTVPPPSRGQSALPPLCATTTTVVSSSEGKGQGKGKVREGGRRSRRNRDAGVTEGSPSEPSVVSLGMVSGQVSATTHVSASWGTSVPGIDTLAPSSVFSGDSVMTVSALTRTIGPVLGSIVSADAVSGTGFPLSDRDWRQVPVAADLGQRSSTQGLGGPPVLIGSVNSDPRCAVRYTGSSPAFVFTQTQGAMPSTQGVSSGYSSVGAVPSGVPQGTPAVTVPPSSWSFGAPPVGAVHPPGPLGLGVLSSSQPLGAGIATFCSVSLSFGIGSNEWFPWEAG